MGSSKIDRKKQQQTLRKRVRHFQSFDLYKTIAVVFLSVFFFEIKTRSRLVKKGGHVSDTHTLNGEGKGTYRATIFKIWHTV